MDLTHTEVQPRRVVIAVMADSHAGNRVGLLAPGTELTDPDNTADTYIPNLSPYQEWLWEHYTEWMKTAREFAGNNTLEVWHNGDAMQGLKYPNQLMTTSVSDQVLIARKNLNAWKTYGVKTMRIITGTASHNFGEGAGEVLLKSLLAADGLDTTLYHHALLTVHEVEFDVAHHGAGPGSREWLRGNVARIYTRDRMVADILVGKKPTACYLRAHYHTYVKEVVTMGDYESVMVISPSLCGLGEYARQVSQSVPVITNGIVLIEIIDGELARVKPLKATLDLRTKERIDE